MHFFRDVHAEFWRSFRDAKINCNKITAQMKKAYWNDCWIKETTEHNKAIQMVKKKKREREENKRRK